MRSETRRISCRHPSARPSHLADVWPLARRRRSGPSRRRFSLETTNVPTEREKIRATLGPSVRGRSRRNPLRLASLSKKIGDLKVSLHSGHAFSNSRVFDASIYLSTSTEEEKTSPPTSEVRTPSKANDILSSPKALPRLPLPITQAGRFIPLSTFVRGLSTAEPDRRRQNLQYLRVGLEEQRRMTFQTSGTPRTSPLSIS